jgi:hypothetical protein
MRSIAASDYAPGLGSTLLGIMPHTASAENDLASVPNLVEIGSELEADFPPGGLGVWRSSDRS